MISLAGISPENRRDVLLVGAVVGDRPCGPLATSDHEFQMIEPAPSAAMVSRSSVVDWNMRNDEGIVEAFFRERGFEPVRYSKASLKHSKTPDFRVMRDGRQSLFCEVKSIECDESAEELGARDEWHGDVRRARGLRRDPIYNRLTNDIHTAVQQFDAVNAGQLYPNVLAFVNHDSGCGSSDLFSVVTGFAVANDGSTFLAFPQFSEGRIKYEKLRIHLFLWFEGDQGPKFRFTETQPELHRELCGLFGVDAKTIPSAAIARSSG